MPAQPQFLYTATTPIGAKPHLKPYSLKDPKGPFSPDRLVYFFSGTAGDTGEKRKPIAAFIGVAFHVLLWCLSVVAIFKVREELDEDEDKALWDYSTVCFAVVLIVFGLLVLFLLIGLFQCFEGGVGYSNIATGVVTLITGGVAAGCIFAFLIVMGHESAQVGQSSFWNATTKALQPKKSFDDRADNVGDLRLWAIMLLFCQVYIYNFLQNNKSYAEIREATTPA